MDIRTLRHVLAIRQHGSFARAAQALRVSQPSLSKSIARLEDELKGQLFVRGATGAVLTPFGELIAEQAVRVLEDVGRLQQTAQLAAGGAGSLLRLGFGPDLKRAFAPRLLDRLTAEHPQLNLVIELSDRRRLLPMLAARELDIIFCVRDAAVNAAGMAVTPLLSSFIVAVAAPGHPLVGERGLSVERFLAFPHAGPRNSQFALQNLLGTASDTQQGPDYAMTDYEAFLPLVMAGRSTIVLPAFAAQPYVNSGEMAVLDFWPTTALDYAGTTTPAAATSPIVSRVLAIGVEIARAMSEEQEALRPGGGAPLPSPLSPNAPPLAKRSRAGTAS